MKLIPIDIDKSKNEQFMHDPDCVEILKVFPEFYKRVGFQKPWIGYFITLDGKEFVASAGYKGKPKDGKVEIAYGTFEKHRRKGIATEICRELVKLSLETDPAVRITAQTLPQNNFSTRILKKNGFEFTGTVFDEEDGDVWEWELIRETI
jgi:ribosomal-protein-alanine N-acetyltransferase